MGKQVLATTRSIKRDDVGSVIDQLAAVGLNVEHQEMFFKSAEGTPEYIELIFDALTWINVFKIAAGAFLARLGSEAGKDLWENKEKVAKAIGDPAAAVIGKIADRLFSAQCASDSNAEIVLSIPVPTDFPGTGIRFKAESELEVAVYLACFSLKADLIEASIEEFCSKHNSRHVSAQLTLLDDGSFSISINEYMQGTEETIVV